MGFWNTTSTTLGNDVTYVNNTYKDANGNNKLTTITSTNTSGYKDVVEGSTQRIGDKPPGLKGLSYAVQNDGKITYKYDDGQGNIKQYNSIQEFSNSSIVGYDANTTKKIKDGMQKNLNAGVESYNKANPTSKIGPATGSNPTGDSTGAKPLTKVEDLKAAVGGSQKSRKNFPTTLRYPLNLDTSKQDKIKFDMVEYRPAEFTSDTKQFGFNRASDRPITKTIGSVFLPIPSGISDTTGCNWGGDPGATADKIALANVAMGTITEGGGGATKAIENVLGAVGSDSGGVKTALATQIAGDASGIGGGLLTRLTGAVLNPNLELLFNSPTLRTFSFTFKMSARSEEEAKQIIGILRFFKQGMAPRKSDSNLFLLSPHTFKITYTHKNQKDPHKFLNRFKECALLNLTTNYTPEGQYATFYDGPMVSYEMQMQFQELEPVFNEDYGPGTGSGGPDTEIGF